MAVLHTELNQAEGTARPSFTAEKLNNTDLTPEKEDLIKWASYSIFNGMSNYGLNAKQELSLSTTAGYETVRQTFV
jgi:hypothetical protein